MNDKKHPYMSNLKPSNCKMIAIINQKGGVGKSTTADALGSALQLKGHKVLWLDLDAQANLSYAFATSQPGMALAILTKETNINQAIEQTARGDIIAASHYLAGLDAIIQTTGKEYRLKEAIAQLQTHYDYIILDTPPALGILTVNALTACTHILISAQADMYSLQGITQLYSSLDAVKTYCNPNLKQLGIVLTRYNARAVISRDLADSIADSAANQNTQLLNSKIRECTALKEAQAMQQSIFTYAPKSNAAIDYMNLTDELLGVF
jgi:chromosome partitioning protein